MPSVGRILERLTVAVDGDTTEVDRKLHGLSDEGKGGSWIGKLGGGAARAAGLMAVAAGAGAAAMGGIGLAAAANAEQSNIAFTSIMGDAGRAKAFLADLNQFAATTPFELPGLRNAASQLLAVGVESGKVIPLMRSIGDATSAMGTGAEGIDRAVTALGQMQVKGKVTGEEMMQLTEAGIPAWDALATVMGTDVATAQEKVSSGQVKVNTLMGAIETSAGPAMGRVKGMMDQQSTSALGLWSTLKDTFGQGLGTMMAPALDSLKGMAPEITAVLGTTMAGVGPDVSNMLTGALSFVKELLPAVAPILSAVAGVMGDTFKTLGPELAKLGPPLLRVVEALLPALPAMANGLAAVIPALIPVINGFARMIEVLPPNVLAALVVGFVGMSKLQEGGILKFASALLPLAGALWGVLAPILPFVAAAAALAAVGYLIYRNWDTIAAFFDRVWEGIKNAFKTGIDATIGFIVGFPGMVWDGIKALPGLIVDLGKMLVGAWWDMQQWLARTAWEGLQELVGFFLKLPGWIFDGLGDLAGLLVGAGADIIRGLWGGAGDMFSKFWGFLTDLPGEIFRSLGDVGQLLVNAGKNVIIGLWNGLGSMGSWLWDKVTGFVTDFVSGAVKGALSIFSPSQVMFGHGRMVAAGLAEGMLGSSGLVAAAAAALASAARPTVPASSFATAAALAGGATGGRSSAAPNVVLQLPGGALIPWSEVGQRVRVMFLDDGDRNAFSTAAG